MIKIINRWKKVEEDLLEKSQRYEDKSYNHTRFKYQAIAIRNCRRQIESNTGDYKWRFDLKSFVIGLVLIIIIISIWKTFIH